MNVIGMWKIKKLGMMNENFEIVFKSADEILAIEDEEAKAEYVQMLGTVIIFKEDNTMDMGVKLPEEMIAAAKADGAPVNDDGIIVMETNAWKEEDGKLFYDSGSEIEIMGEKQSSFIEIKIEEDGCLNMNGMMLFEKA